MQHCFKNSSYIEFPSAFRTHWNKIEHRMFCHITANWRGRPLTSYQVVLETIAATTTAAGLRIGAELDTGDYALGTTVTTAEFHALPITPDAFHGNWNYALAPDPPNPPEEPVTRRPIDPAVTLMLTDPTLTGMARSEFAHLVEVSEPYWDALAEAAFQQTANSPHVRGEHPYRSTLTVIHGQALGGIGLCQVAVHLSYVTTEGHALNRPSPVPGRGLGR